MILFALTSMNALDKNQRGFAAWCDDCDLVFDDKWETESHTKDSGHRVRTTEFWIIGRR